MKSLKAVEKERKAYAREMRQRGSELTVRQKERRSESRSERSL